MLRKSLITAAVMLLLTPALACAGLVYVNVATGSATGSATPSGSLGYKTATVPVTFTANATYTLDYVKNGSFDSRTDTSVPPKVSGTGPWSYTVPVTSTTQNVYVYFKKTATSYPTELKAVLPTSITAGAGVPYTINGQQSTIKYLPPGTSAHFKFTSASGTTTFSPAEGDITSPSYVVTTATTTGPDTVSLVLTGNSITSNTASATLTFMNHGMLLSQSQGCLACHLGWAETDAFAAQTSGHAAHGHGPGCGSCHSAGNHPFTVQCSSCHASNAYGNMAMVPAYSTASCGTCHPGGTGTGSIHQMTRDTAPTSIGIGTATTCVTCHVDDTNHALNATAGVAKCIDCHASVISHPGNVVSDNSGVRAVVGEFSKRSHHVTGVAPNDFHCAACHLEGKVVSGAVVVDGTYHMANATTHLRNADSDADMQWDPAAPSHSTMDNFCMSCHDDNGATSTGSQAIQAANGGSALNPFNDTISNDYDKMLRGRVVNVSGQFDTGNNSHHAVKGKKYSGRTQTASTEGRTVNASVFNANVDPADPELAGTRYTLYDAGRFVSTYTTLADAAGEPATRNGGQSLGDDSTLHCGDCHTVGQWKQNAAKNGDGTDAPAAIGAHGSNNEYMLRNSVGTDELHRGAQYSYAPANMSKNTGVASSSANFAGQQFGEWPLNEVTAQVNMNNVAVPADEVPTSKPFLVCYNCHVYTVYGSVYFSNTAGGGREGSHAFGDHTRGNYCNGPYNTSGSGRATTWTAVYGAYNAGTNSITYQGVTGFNMTRLQPGTTTGGAPAGMNGSGAGSGNIFQIQCASCHNSGPDNGFGGIHGSKINTYTDALGNASNARRFLPGLGNVKWVPGTPTEPEAVQWEQEADPTNAAGCYTLTTVSGAPGDMAPPTTPEAGGTNNTASASSSGKMFGQWGACNDHSSVDGLERTIQRPVSY